MAGIYIILSLLTLFIFVITRTVWVRIMTYGEWVLELHFSILALRMRLSSGEGGGKGAVSPRFYARLVGRIGKVIKKSELSVGRLAIPGVHDAGVGGYFWALSAAIAYLATATRGLQIKNNAFTLISDSSAIELDITAQLPLYRLLFFGAAVLYDLMKERLAKRRK